MDDPVKRRESIFPPNSPHPYYSERITVIHTSPMTFEEFCYLIFISLLTISFLYLLYRFFKYFDTRSVRINEYLEGRYVSHSDFLNLNPDSLKRQICNLLVTQGLVITCYPYSLTKNKPKDCCLQILFTNQPTGRRTCTYCKSLNSQNLNPQCECRMIMASWEPLNVRFKTSISILQSWPGGLYRCNIERLFDSTKLLDVEAVLDCGSFQLRLLRGQSSNHVYVKLYDNKQQESNGQTFRFVGDIKTIQLPYYYCSPLCSF